MYVPMEIDKGLDNFEFVCPFDVDMEKELGNEIESKINRPPLNENGTFPDLKSYYSYILYNTVRLFPLFSRGTGQLLMIEPPKSQETPGAISQRTRLHSSIDPYQPGTVYKRKCSIESTPNKYLKCSF